MAHPDPDDHLRRQLRTLQRVVGDPTDAVLARRSGMAAATFSEAMSGKRRPRREFVAKVVAGCMASARAGGRAALDEQHVLHALRLPGHTAADSGILERDGDLDSCSAVLDRVRARAGATVVVEGAAGIGKSELLARICAESAVRGITPLVVRGNHRDQTLAFGGVRTLLARWVAGHSAKDRQELFAGAAAFARVPLGLAPPGQGTAGGVIGLTEALYWLVVNATDLGRDDALLLAVDDAHWLDEESLDWLEFLADRVAGLPVVLVLAFRPDDPAPAAALRRIALRASPVIRPQPLSVDAVRAIVDRGLGRREPADGAFCAAFRHHSGGNPFYLRWMLDLARDRGLPPTAGSAAGVAELTPRQVVVHLNERLRDLGPDARRLARTVAVLAPGTPLDRAVRLAGLTPDEGKREYDRLCNAAILADRADLDFRHPIIRGAVYDDIDPSQRSDIHLAAAKVLHGEDASPGVVAAHLLRVHAAGDQWVVDRLDAAATEAMASGSAGTAARYLGRAVVEPPVPARRCQVRLRHGQALALGEMATALPELLAAYEEAPDDRLRTEAAIALAKTYAYANRLGDAVRHLDRALAVSPPGRSCERLTSEQLLWATWWADDPRRPDRMRLLDRIAAPLPGAGHVERLLITLRAWSLVLRGAPVAEAAGAIGPVLRDGVAFTDLDLGMEVGTMTAFVHMYSNDLVVAGRLFDQAVAEFERHGWRGTHLAFARTHQGNVALRQGRLADAVADADIALRLADRTGPGTPAEWFATGTLVEALLARGEVDRAAAVAADRGYTHPHPGSPRPDAIVLPIPQVVHAALDLARGRTAAAVAALRRTGRWLDHAHLLNPSVFPWRFGLVRALRHSAPEEARAIAAEGRELADRFGDPTTRASALRTLATVRPDSAADLLEEAVRLLEDTPNRLEHAHALADFAAALARRGQDARERWSAALALADECGALGLRADLARRLGAPPGPSRVNALDPRLRRVARLSAEGRSETEIAHDMVLRPDTVERLLRDAGERLGVGSPAELRGVLG